MGHQASPGQSMQLRLQILSSLSHVLSVNMLSSEKRTGNKCGGRTVLVFSDKLQLGCTVPSCQLRSHLQRGCDSLDRSMHAVGLLEIILLSSFSYLHRGKVIVLLYYCPQQPHKYGCMGQTQHTFWPWPIWKDFCSLSQ